MTTDFNKHVITPAGNERVMAVLDFHEARRYGDEEAMAAARLAISQATAKELQTQGL